MSFIDRIKSAKENTLELAKNSEERVIIDPEKFALACVAGLNDPNYMPDEKLEHYVECFIKAQNFINETDNGFFIQTS